MMTPAGVHGIGEELAFVGEANVSHEEIMLGPHSGSKHQTTQLIFLDSSSL